MDKYEIPNSWEWTTLEEVFFIERGGSPRPIKSFLTDDEDGINWIKIGDVAKGQKYIKSTREKIKSEGLKKSRLVVEGDFILSNSMSFGRPYIVKTKGAIHDGWLVFRDATKELDKDFFYYLLSSTYIYQQFSRNASGSTVKNLNIDIVKQTNISLPPLNEQKRIVSKIEKLFANLDNNDKYLVHLEKQLKRYRQSVLKSAFEGELTKEWREKQTNLECSDEVLEKIKLERTEYIENEVREKFKDKTEKWIKDKVQKEIEQYQILISKVLQKMDNDWIRLSLESITHLLGDGLHGTPKYTEDTDYYFINGNNLSNGKIELKSDTKTVSEEEYLKYKKNLTENTILVSINGTLGNLAFYSNEKVMLGKSACYFNLFKVINKSYIFYLLKSYDFIVYANKTATGSTIKNVPLKAMRNYLIPLCSQEEQQEIVNQIEKHFSIIDKLEATVEQSIKESKKLRQSILKQAFEGKLVEQDQNEESAEILLEKIAKAKEEYKKAQKKQARKK